MQAYIVLLLVATVSAIPVTTLLKHKPNNAPVLNLNHENVHITQQVPFVNTVDVVAPQVYTTLNKQVIPQVYTTLNKQVIPQAYTTLNKQVVPQVYTTTVNKQVVPQVYTTLNKQVVPQVYTTLNKQVVPQVYSHVQPIHTPIIHTPIVQTPVQTPIVYSVPQQMTVAQQTELTKGYVAANHGSLHTAPLPEGPSGDGFFASHHINLPEA